MIKWVLANNFAGLLNKSHRAFLYRFICIYFRYVYIPFPFRKVDMDWRHNDGNQISWILVIVDTIDVLLRFPSGYESRQHLLILGVFR